MKIQINKFIALTHLMAAPCMVACDPSDSGSDTGAATSGTGDGDGDGASTAANTTQNGTSAAETTGPGEQDGTSSSGASDTPVEDEGSSTSAESDDTGSTTDDSLFCVDAEAGEKDKFGIVFEGDTTGMGDDIAAACARAPEGAGDGEDAVILWTAPFAGHFVMEVLADFDSVLLVTEPSCDDGAEVACNDDCFGLSAAVGRDFEAGESVLLVVDAYAGEGGPFEIAINEDEPGTPVCEGR